MDKGAAVEYDTPENLFRQGGIFYSMCDKSNITIEDIEVSSIELYKCGSETNGCFLLGCISSAVVWWMICIDSLGVWVGRCIFNKKGGEGLQRRCRCIVSV